MLTVLTTDCKKCGNTSDKTKEMPRMSISTENTPMLFVSLLDIEIYLPKLLGADLLDVGVR